MLTFAFTCLCLVLFAGIGVLGYFLAKRQFEIIIRGIQAGSRASDRKRRKELKTFREQLHVMTENIKIIAGERKKDILINTEGMAPWQASMETRAIEAERNKVVAVDNRIIGQRKSA